MRPHTPLLQESRQGGVFTMVKSFDQTPQMVVDRLGCGGTDMTLPVVALFTGDDG